MTRRQLEPRCAALLGAVALLLAAGCTSASTRPTLDRAFVSETASATIAVLDLDKGLVEQRIEVGLLPHNLVLSPDRQTLYTALAGSQSVAVVDTASATLKATWLTAPVPERRDDGSVIQQHLDRGAFTHTTCYDCHRDGGAKPRYVGARPVGLRLSADGARLYVSHLNSGELVVLDTATGARLAATTLAPVGAVKEPAGLDLLGDELYVSMRATQPTHVPGLVRRLDAQTLAVRGDLPSGANPVEVRAAPALGVALVTRFDSNQLSLVNAGGEAASVTVANGPLGVLGLPGDRALVLGYYSNAVSVVDLHGGPADTWSLTLDGTPLANPTHAALGSDPGLAWVVQSGTDAHLIALDLVARRVVRSLPIDALSYDVAIIPGAASTP
jgi:DNA-binding beta-propeller fold protein YncE